MESLHNKSFNNLCGVADWLIISDLNAILLGGSVLVVLSSSLLTSDFTK